MAKFYFFFSIFYFVFCNKISFLFFFLFLPSHHLFYDSMDFYLFFYSCLIIYLIMHPPLEGRCFGDRQREGCISIFGLIWLRSGSVYLHIGASRKISNSTVESLSYLVCIHSREIRLSKLEVLKDLLRSFNSGLTEL